VNAVSLRLEMRAMAEPTGEVLTIEELSEYLKIPKSTLYKLVREGSVPSLWNRQCLPTFWQAK